MTNDNVYYKRGQGVKNQQNFGNIMYVYSQSKCGSFFSDEQTYVYRRPDKEFKS